jgi:hypothetical protein
MRELANFSPAVLVALGAALVFVVIAGLLVVLGPGERGS